MANHKILLGGLFLLSAIPAGAITIPVFPANHVYTSSVTLSWQTDAPGTLRVDYGTIPTFGTSVPVTSPTTAFSTDIAGLGADTLYYYQIVDPSNATVQLASGTWNTFIPLNDLGAGTHKGFQGGLYENGSNSVPVIHDADGQELAHQVQPLDSNGTPSASGVVVLMSVGMSNCTLDWCGVDTDFADSICTPSNQSFMDLANSDPTWNHKQILILDGAAGGQVATRWDPKTGNGTVNYDRVRDHVLAPAGVTEKQVQVIWMKNANSAPSGPLPAAGADAYVLEAHFANALREIKIRYPNVKMVFITSRIYAGYAITDLNPEPFAYEGGFAVKWLIQAQITQMRTGVVDPVAGDLNYESGAAPWIAWGPYIWANGLHPRSDGLTWQPTEYNTEDGTHPNVTSGVPVVGHMLLDFFKTSPYAHWFTTQVNTTSSSGSISPRVFPNPWRADRAISSQITFDSLAGNITIKIFTLSGRWVKTLTTSNPSVTWDLKNDSGDRVASGLYYYLVKTDQGQKIRGTLAIIR